MSDKPTSPEERRRRKLAWKSKEQLLMRRALEEAAKLGAQARAAGKPFDPEGALEALLEKFLREHENLGEEPDAEN